MNLYKKRTDLIIDYISQILVYGSNTNGNITINKNTFDDGDYLILTISVVKNSYFRWHDLGIKIEETKEFYDHVNNATLKKFKKFDIRYTANSLIISSKVNNNQVELSFTLLDKELEKWFDITKESFYNKDK